jgi:predicted transposase/invertase (TIGR01784 family)
MEQVVEKASERQNGGEKMLLWLSLFKAETVEDLDKLRSFGVPEINKAIDAYYEITSSPEFREIERLKEKIRHYEASALSHAQDEGETKSQADGKVECIAQIAQNLKTMGFSNEQIQTITGLPTETI